MKRERIYLILGYFCKLAIFGSKIKANVFYMLCALKHMFGLCLISVIFP